MKHWLVIYDVRDPRRLNRIAKVMTEYGVRVQKSVFEVEAGELIIRRLRRKIQKLMAEEDFVVYFEICERDWQKREKYGAQEFEDSEEEPYYIY